MMRPSALFPLLALSACGGGLWVDDGNAFPCDFSQGPGARDQACPVGWVCGVTNVCQQKVDEGIPVGLPHISVTNPQHVAPQFISSPLTSVAADATGTRFLVTTATGTFALDALSVMVQTSGMPLLLPPMDEGVFTPSSPDGGMEGVFLSDGVASALSFAPAEPSSLGGNLLAPPVEPLGPAGSLTVHVQGPTTASVVAVTSDGGTLLSNLRVDGGAVLTNAIPVPDAGAVSVLQPLPYAGALYQLAFTGALSGAELDVKAPSKTWDTVVSLPNVSPDAGNSIFTGAPLVRSSQDGRVVACLYTGDTRAGATSASPELYVFGLSTGAANASGIAFSPLWSPCVPCAGQVLAINPLSVGSASVEVLCQLPSGTNQLFAVVGSNGATTCVKSALVSPIPLTEVTSVDLATNGQVTVGGAHGQIWSGDSFQALAPVFLDRPASVAHVSARLPDGGSGSGKAWLVDGLTFVPVSNNGFANVALVDPQGELPPERIPAAYVRGTTGWFINASGTVLWMDVSQLEAGRPVARFGPTLVGPEGAALGPFSGEGVNASALAAQALPDGGYALSLTGASGGTLVVTADDSLYAWDVDLSGLTSDLSSGDSLAPVLTPQPGFPIRSFALVEAQDAGAPIDGYISTLNTVFRLQYAGTPPHWTATPLVLPGEPVSVWTANDGTRHGRVGLEDGTIFTLPGVFPLTEPLPVTADGGVDAVVGYTDVVGWPVARAQSGALYQAAPTDAGIEGLLAWQPLLTETQMASMTSLGSRYSLVFAGSAAMPELELVGSNGDVYSMSVVRGAPAR